MADNDLCETPQPTQQSVLNRPGKDKFLLVLNLPLILKKQAQNSSALKVDSLQMSVHGTLVPTIQVPANEVRFGGQSLNVSSHARPNYSPLTVNFIVDNKFTNYWVLWKWLNILNSSRSSKYLGDLPKTINEKIEEGNLLEYQSNMSIFALNEYNEKIVEFTYYHTFITTLGSINYSYRDNEIIETTAEFQFGQFDMRLIT